MGLDLPAKVVTGEVFSAYTINTLAAAALELDRESHRPVEAFDSHVTGYDLGVVYPTPTVKGNFRVWWGGLRWQTGFTTLTIEGRITKVASETLQVYINGVLNSTIVSSGDFTHTLSIASGYGNGDVLLIEIIKVGNTAGMPSITILDVYATPVSLAGWPGIPVIGTSYPAATINQMVDAALWLYSRMNLIPYVLPQRSLFQPSNYKHNSVTQLWTGSVGRYHTNDQLQVELNWSSQGNTSESLHVYIGGNLAGTFGPYGVGSRALAIGLPLSHTIGTRSEVQIQLAIGAAGGNPTTRWHSRFSITRIRSGPNGSDYNYSAAIPDLASNALISQASVTSQLNTIGTLLATVYARIITNGAGRFDRVRAFRRRYALDEAQNTKLANTYLPRMYRKANALIVRGKNVRLGWGGLNVAETDDADAIWQKIEPAYSAQLVEGDTIDTKIVTFDGFEGLYQGTLYQLFGDVHWAAEYLEA